MKKYLKDTEVAKGGDDGEPDSSSAAAEGVGKKKMVELQAVDPVPLQCTRFKFNDVLDNSLPMITIVEHLMCLKDPFRSIHSIQLLSSCSKKTREFYWSFGPTHPHPFMQKALGVLYPVTDSPKFGHIVFSDYTKRLNWWRFDDLAAKVCLECPDCDAMDSNPVYLCHAEVVKFDDIRVYVKCQCGCNFSVLIRSGMRLVGASVACEPPERVSNGKLVGLMLRRDFDDLPEGDETVETAYEGIRHRLYVSHSCEGVDGIDGDVNETKEKSLQMLRGYFGGSMEEMLETIGFSSRGSRWHLHVDVISGRSITDPYGMIFAVVVEIDQGQSFVYIIRIRRTDEGIMVVKTLRVLSKAASVLISCLDGAFFAFLQNGPRMEVVALGGSSLPFHSDMAVALSSSKMSENLLHYHMLNSDYEGVFHGMCYYSKQKTFDQALIYCLSYLLHTFSRRGVLGLLRFAVDHFQDQTEGWTRIYAIMVLSWKHVLISSESDSHQYYAMFLEPRLKHLDKNKLLSLLFVGFTELRMASKTNINERVRVYNQSYSFANTIRENLQSLKLTDIYARFMPELDAETKWYEYMNSDSPNITNLVFFLNVVCDMESEPIYGLLIRAMRNFEFKDESFMQTYLRQGLVHQMKHLGRFTKRGDPPAQYRVDFIQAFMDVLIKGSFEKCIIECKHTWDPEVWGLLREDQYKGVNILLVRFHQRMEEVMNIQRRNAMKDSDFFAEKLLADVDVRKALRDSKEENPDAHDRVMGELRYSLTSRQTSIVEILDRY